MIKDDVLIVGAGPAGSVAATILARAGIRVRLIDRAMFPRPKLCGDTINPGTLAALRSLRLSRVADDRGLRVDGMRVTGPTGIAIETRYPAGLYGRALLRRDLDWLLLQEAIAAGARFEPALTVRGPVVDESAGMKTVVGVVVGTRGREQELRAAAVLAADGRQSTLAFSLGLARHPPQPRRWAVGAYYEGVTGLSSLGEMHVRHGRYIGVAPVPGGLANVCLVMPARAGDDRFRRPAVLLDAEVAGNPLLRDRFSDAHLVQPPVVLGPLAVESSSAHFRGLVLAGDAAGFIDPMTGDGLRFAVRGGALAAEAIVAALEHGWSGVHERLAAARRREFAMKWRFNRALRALVSAPAAVDAATVAARLMPRLLQRLVVVAGDCRLGDA